MDDEVPSSTVAAAAATVAAAGGAVVAAGAAAAAAAATTGCSFSSRDTTVNIVIAAKFGLCIYGGFPRTWLQ